MGFLKNWNTAGKIGYVMHKLTVEQGAPIKEGACHSVVRAYGWKQTTLLVDEMKERLDEFETYRVVAKMIAYYVYGRELGGQHAQEAAYDFLQGTGALNDLDWNDTSDPVVAKVLAQQQAQS
ncbi:hypothetical protein [Marinomonas ostreistagni]|uniref:hypothetical protein n=1 Tax=Marinomonas ostreistagni TaxID=359209 RepID=UPI001951E864|nr:hypothetical protein [Marinomonas ostreistagni]MBM6550155.1 hypothetical protein [Marinomonas ostreistagni]